jgi:hypothetical protein
VGTPLLRCWRISQKRVRAVRLASWPALRIHAQRAGVVLGQIVESYDSGQPRGVIVSQNHFGGLWHTRGPAFGGLSDSSRDSEIAILRRYHNQGRMASRVSVAVPSQIFKPKSGMAVK